MTSSRGRRYRVEIKPSAAHALQRLRAPVRAKLTAIIDALADDPRPAGCKKLAGSAKLCRVRAAGVYRIVYEVRDEVLTVVVIRLGHRRDVCRGL